MSSLHPLSSHPTPRAEWARRGIAVFLVLHAIAHLVGAQAAIEAAGGGDAVRLLGGLVEVTGGAATALAIAWIAVAAGVVFAAAWVWAHHVWWWDAVVAVLGASLLLSVLALPQAVVGVVIDVVLLALVLSVRDDAIDDVLW